MRFIVEVNGIGLPPITHCQLNSSGYACHYLHYVEGCTVGDDDCSSFPARKYVNWLLRNRLMSSTLTAAAVRRPPRRADRVSILQLLHPLTNGPSRQEFDRGRLGRNYCESWAQFVDLEKSEHNPFKKADASPHSDPAKSLVGFGSRTERCPTRAGI